MSNPAIFMVPDVGFTSQVKLLKVVDLPAPFTPSKQKHSPAERPKESFSTAKNGVPGLHIPFPVM